MCAAALHVMGDIQGSLAAIVSAIIIIYTGWMSADPILSLLSAGLILRGSWSIVRRSTHILLEGAPEDFDGVAVHDELLNALPDLVDVHGGTLWHQSCHGTDRSPFLPGPARASFACKFP